MGSNTSRSSHSCAISKLFLIVMNIPSWLIVVVLLIAGQLIAYKLGKDRREFLDRLNKVFDTRNEETRLQFYQKETVAALDDIARAAGSMKVLLLGILVLLILLLANAIN